MRKLFFALLLGTIFVFACFAFVFHQLYNNNNISIRVKETDDSYSLYASYNRHNARRLQHFISKSLHTNHFSDNSYMNSYITLEDNTHFYIKTRPGNLYLKLDKRNNDEEGYIRIKKLGEEIKRKLAED
ncbi:MAG: hypothetical protein KGO92_05540 [Bacteroidota bacterium]|nr:hypothetical protein [Bacteroidota bacterium]